MLVLTWIATVFAVAVGCIVLFGIVCSAQIVQLLLRRRWRRKIAIPNLAAYARRRSIEVGQTIQLCVHADQPATVQVLRLGAELEAVGETREVLPYKQSPRYDYWRGCNWTVNLELATTSFRPGLYIVELRATDGSSVYRVAVLLRSSVPAPLAVIASTNTWDAYNDFAGLSNYEQPAIPLPLRIFNQTLRYLNIRFRVGNRHWIPVTPLPLQRPNDAIDRDLQGLDSATDDASTTELRPKSDKFSHLLLAEWSAIRHLEKSGIEYGVYSDEDFAFDPSIDQAKCLLFNTHSEYWSAEMQGRLDRLMRRGRKVLFLSGNNIYRQVEFLQSGIRVVDQLIDAEVAAKLIGLGYDARGYTDFASYRLLNEEHWVVRETGSVGREFCRADATVSDAPQYGGSGWETDKSCRHSGDVVVLARGTNAEGPAEIVFKELPDGGWVFNTGSVSSSVWLGHDPVLTGMVDNLLEDALGISQAVGSSKEVRPVHRMVS